MAEKKLLSITLTLENQTELGTKGETIAKGEKGLAYRVALDESRNVYVKEVLMNVQYEYVFDGAKLQENKRKYNFHC